MPTYNYKAKELIAKIVYYGPGRCGKTTNLQQIHAKMRPETRSDLLSVATETDRTIYFDLLPLNLGTINGMKFMVRLFTVPGQVYYAETRKIVLRGADGIVFVADSQDHMADENRESLRDLKRNLEANGIDYASVPLVLQYNKRDLPRLIPEAELDAMLNDRGVKALNAVASRGDGVLETLRTVTVGVFNGLKQSASPLGTTAARRGPTVAAGTGPKAGPPPPPDADSVPPEHASEALPPLQAPPRSQTRTASLDAAREAARSAARQAVGPLAGAPPGQTPLSPSQFAAPAVPTPPLGWAPAPSGTPGQPVAVAPSTSAGGFSPPPIPSGPVVAPATSFGGTARPLPPPATLGVDFLLDEFRNLAAIQAQLAERMQLVEQELRRIGRDQQELRETIVGQLG